MNWQNNRSQKKNNLYLSYVVCLPAEIGSFHTNGILEVWFVSDCFGIKFVRVHKFVDPFHRDLALHKKYNLRLEKEWY